jgi:diacylglycerol O-acyltransferase
MPLYLAGARMITNYPVSIVTHGLALNVTLQSYNGSLDFGLIACRRAMPDVQEFKTCLVTAHAELLAAARAIAAAAQAEVAEPIAVAPAKKRAPRKSAAAKPVAKPAARRTRASAAA